MLTFLNVVACALMLVAAVTDIRSYRIPNWISVALVALFAVRAAVAPVSLIGSLTIGAIILAAGFVLFATRLFGAGDAKLMAALSLWIGPGLILEFLMATALAGGVVATVIVFCRKAVAPSAVGATPQGGMNVPDDADPILGGKRVSSPMPYGVAIVAGGLWCVARQYFGS